jgi:hypothetical protein
MCGALRHLVAFLLGPATRPYSQVPLLLSRGKDCRKLAPPPQCKTFLWLAMRDKCWTGSRLEKRGMSYLEVCPLCD